MRDGGVRVGCLAVMSVICDVWDSGWGFFDVEVRGMDVLCVGAGDRRAGGGVAVEFAMFLG